MKLTQTFRITLMALALGGASAASQAASDTIRVVTDPTFPPMEMTVDGKRTGFDIELTEALAQAMGKKIAWTDIDFKGLIPAVISGRADAAMSAIYITDERKKAVDFTDSYYAGGLVVLTKQDGPVKTLKDLDGKRIYTFPTAGRFLAQFGVVPVQLPYEDVQVALQTGEIDGVAWSGITEDYTVGWADVTDHFTTNNISGAWIGSWFVNEKSWADIPQHLKDLWVACIDACHQYRNQWYWGGEAKLRADGEKLKLTTIPANEWAEVENAALKFWDEVAAESEVKAKVVGIFKQYNEMLKKAGGVYTQG